MSYVRYWLIWQRVLLLLVILLAPNISVQGVIREWVLHSGRIAKKKADGGLHILQVTARHAVGKNATLDQSMTDFCAALTYMDPMDCRHCLITNFELQLIHETRPSRCRGVLSKDNSALPFKDRVVRKMSRIYKFIENDQSIRKICLIGHFEEQILRFFAFFLKRRHNLQVSLSLVGYGRETDASNKNVETLYSIISQINLDFGLETEQIHVSGWAQKGVELKQTNFQTCDILHFQNIARPNFDVHYDQLMVKSGVNWSNRIEELLSDSVMWDIVRQVQHRTKSANIPGTLVIVETDVAQSFDTVRVPPTADIPIDIQTSFRWLSSAIVFDGEVRHERNVMTDGGVLSSCGKRIGAISDAYVSPFSSALRIGIVSHSTKEEMSAAALTQASTYSSFASWKQNTLIVISFSSYIFIETARGLRTALVESIGFPVENVLVVGYLSLPDILQTRLRTSVLQIFIGAHQGENWLLPTFLLFHTENHWNSYSSQSDIYTRLLKQAEGIMVYSSAHFAYIQQLRLSTRNDTKDENDVREVIIPLYSEPNYYIAKVEDVQNAESSVSEPTVRVYAKYSDAAILPDGFESVVPYMHDTRECASDAINDDARYHYDVAMIGTLANRRNLLVRELIFHYVYDVRKARLRQIPERPAVLINFQVAFTDPETGGKGSLNEFEHLGYTVDVADIHTRETVYVLSRVTLNVHQQDEVVMETHRVNNLISLGQAIVSERTSYFDQNRTTSDFHQWLLDDSYEAANAVQFVNNWSELLDVAEALAAPASRAKWRALQLRAFRFYQDQVSKNVSELNTLLHHTYKRQKLSLGVPTL